MNDCWRALLIAASFAISAPALAQDFPTRTVRVVVPFPPGGSADLIARLLAEKLGREWSQSVVVENRAGVNGGLGADAVTKSPPDGERNDARSWS